MYKRIMVPIDGSETAERGLQEAIGLASRLNARLCLLNVTSDFPIMVEMANTIDVEKYREGLHRFGVDLLAKAKAASAARDVEAETMITDLRGGRVSEAIVREAQVAKCELIVIGTHGRRGLRRALLGSDAEAVVRTSTVPVLLVRDGGSDAN
jgi:nucleotide-binding universal stress UspA family protein